MKIGIVTQPLTTNYGGILQNYALQQVLKDMGHEVWTIDYCRFNWLDWIDITCRVFAHKMLGHKVSFAKTPKERRIEEAPLRKFVYENIHLTMPRTRRFESRILNKYSFDTVVVGSDQVWRPKYNYNVEDCFLRFALGEKIKRVAYAASFGTDDWEFSETQTAKCAKLAKLFSGISVREKSGIELCKEHLGVDAVNVLDPTLLLQREDYLHLCDSVPRRDPFVLAYILDESVEKQGAIIEFAKSKGLPYILKTADSKVEKDDSIELWLSYFRDASFIITDSFHGTIFSIIFNKEFYSYRNVLRGNSRFDNLLELFELEDRVIVSGIPNIHKRVNWGNVNRIKVANAEKSKAWLKNNLNNE